MTVAPGSTGAIGWARRLQAIAQTGLTYASDPYDRERYEAVRVIAAEIAAAASGATVAEVVDLFGHDTGYATPKVDVRMAVFDAADRLLLVREAADGGWTLPGGWADVDRTVSQSAVTEVREEAGIEVGPPRLIAALDRTAQGHPDRVFSCLKLIFLARHADGTLRPDGQETLDAAWFERVALPTPLSLARTLPSYLELAFAAQADAALPVRLD